MAAIDNRHLLEIINIIPQKFKGKDGREGTLHKAQCLMHGGEGGVVVGLLLLPKTLIETPPGKYLAEFELGVDYKLNVVPKVIAFHEWKGKTTPEAPAPAKGA